jgi:hypothetical protein
MPRQNIQNMTPEQMAIYVETVRARNRLNAKNYYDNKIKTDPEKYEKFKVKCAKASKSIIPVLIIDLNKLKINLY